MTHGTRTALSAVVLLGGCQEILIPPDTGIDEAGPADPAIALRVNELGQSSTHVFGFRFPWRRDVHHTVIQYPHAYRAQIWHAIDFDLSWQEEILAMKPGRINVLVDSVTDYPLGTQCQRLECNQTTNFMIVQHDDGTESSYLHLLKGSASWLGLKVGDSVCEGQHIGDVGLNGFTSGPHLHVSAQDAGSQSWSDMFSRPTHQITFDEISPQSVVQGSDYASNNEPGDTCGANEPPSPCTGKADGGYCGGLLAGYGGSSGDLVTCSGGNLAAAKPCPSGCQGDAPGSACKAPATSPCSGKNNGKYCGATLPGYSGSNDLVTCSGGTVAQSTGCAQGCQVNPPGTDDMCKAAAAPCGGKANGKYCGSSLSSYGGGNDLVTCSGGGIAATMSCASGCQVNPPGTDDVCKAGPGSPCAGKNNGKYCGSSLPGYTGAGSDLVTCIGGTVSATGACARGCQQNPPGVDDACK